MQHADSSAQSLEYAQRRPRVSLWQRARPVFLVLALLAMHVVFWFLTVGYVDHQWRSLTPGMTRAQFDQKLWAFTSYPSQYQGLWPGQYVIRYELFRMGKATMIQIIFNADGTVADAQPIYDI